MSRVQDIKFKQTGLKPINYKIPSTLGAGAHIHTHTHTHTHTQKWLNVDPIGRKTREGIIDPHQS